VLRRQAEQAACPGIFQHPQCAIGSDPYVPGPYLPAGLRLLHISDDPTETGRAQVGDSLLGDAVLSLEGLKQLLGDCKPKPSKARERVPHRMAPHGSSAAKASDDGRLTAAQVFRTLKEVQHFYGNRKSERIRRGQKDAREL
jgi:hypothetical protein